MFKVMVFHEVRPDGSDGMPIVEVRTAENESAIILWTPDAIDDLVALLQKARIQAFGKVDARP